MKLTIKIDVDPFVDSSLHMASNNDQISPADPPSGTRQLNLIFSLMKIIYYLSLMINYLLF
jgi:hypothetical protein